MGKRQVIGRFIVLSVIWCLVWGAVAIHVGDEKGDAIFAIGLAILAAIAWGAFTPNAPLFGSVVSRGNVRQPIAALTFDDGPSAEHTPKILDVLRANEVPATSFVP